MSHSIGTGLVLLGVAMALFTAPWAIDRGAVAAVKAPETAEEKSKGVEDRPKSVDRRLEMQVRFIAQPQNRYFVPVTYLCTPASAEEVYPVLNEVLMTGTDLAGVTYEDLHKEGYALTLALTEAGGKRMARVTQLCVGEQLAIILNGKILMYPYVRDLITSVIEIRGGNGALKDNARSLHEWYGELEE